MTEISANELKAFENLLIDSGHVLNFKYSEFVEYVFRITKIYVDDKEYLKKVESHYSGSSAGKILKYFIYNESETNVIKLLKELVDYVEYCKNDITINQDDLDKCKSILLKKNKTYLKNNISHEEQIINLINDINRSIEEGKPEFSLDRLHTLLNYYFKDLCDKHEIEYEKKDKLNQVFKKYVKNVSKKLDSELSKTILEQTVSIFDKFNHVRNNKTYAHDNNILNRAESLLIYNDIVNIFEFIKNIENNVLSIDK